ncbi:unnamed protein product [Ectocarpus sp. 12 AP-2014]
MLYQAMVVFVCRWGGAVAKGRLLLPPSRTFTTPSEASRGKPMVRNEFFRLGPSRQGGGCFEALQAPQRHNQRTCLIEAGHLYRRTFLFFLFSEKLRSIAQPRAERARS